MEHIRSYSLEIKNIRVHNVYHMYIYIYLENFYYSCWKMHGSRGVIRWVERNQKAPIGETWGGTPKGTKWRKARGTKIARINT